MNTNRELPVSMYSENLYENVLECAKKYRKRECRAINARQEGVRSFNGRDEHEQMKRAKRWEGRVEREGVNEGAGSKELKDEQCARLW